MTTAYTSLLGLALPVTGELSGTWGDTVNTAITSLLDTAVAGTTSITTDADITLTTTTGASNQARQAILLWNPASGTTTRYITAPAQSKLYTVINASGGTQSIVIRGVGPTTGVTIAKGESAMVAWNGSDFVKVSSSGGAITFTDLTVTGNTILGDAAADTLTVNATSTFASPVNFQGLVKLPSTGRSAAAALTVTAPAFLYGVASTYTDTTSSGTVAAMAPFYSIAQPTLSTSNVTTYTNAATLYIANAPAAGGSATITNPYALYVAGGANYFAGNATFASNVTLGDAAADTVTVNGTITSNLIFTDNTYDIGASGATRPRNFYLAGNEFIGGTSGITGTLFKPASSFIQWNSTGASGGTNYGIVWADSSSNLNLGAGAGNSTVATANPYGFGVGGTPVQYKGQLQVTGTGNDAIFGATYRVGSNTNAAFADFNGYYDQGTSTGRYLTSNYYGQTAFDLTTGTYTIKTTPTAGTAGASLASLVQGLAVSKTQQVALGNVNYSAIGTTVTPSISFDAGGTSYATIKAADGLSGNADGRLLFGNGNNTVGALRMVFNSTTNVAVDAVTWGSSASEVTLQFQANGGAANFGGNLSVGTTSSNGRLTVVGSAVSAIPLGFDTNASYAQIQSYASSPLYIQPLGNPLSLNSGGGYTIIGATPTTFNSSRQLQVLNSILVGKSLYTYTAWDTDTAGNMLLYANANPANTGANSNIIFNLGTSGGGGPSEIARIVSSGSMGVMNTAPANYGTFVVGVPNRNDGLTTTLGTGVFAGAITDSPSNSFTASTAILRIIGNNATNNLQFGVGANAYSYNPWIQASFDNSSGGSTSNGVKDLILQPIGGNVLVGVTTSSSASTSQVRANSFVGSLKVSVTALNTNYVIYGAINGIVVVRDDTTGGSALWLLDPNLGIIQIANNITKTITFVFSSGYWYIRQTAGSVTTNYSIVALYPAAQ